MLWYDRFQRIHYLSILSSVANLNLAEENKMNDYNEDFWNALDELVNTSEIVIDRPKGSAHPRFPDFIYRVDYGYLKNTSSMDGAARY